MCPLVSLFRSAGKVGKVVEDDRSAQPFKVKAKGKTWWYQRKALEKVTEEGCSDNDDEDDSDEDTSDNSSESDSDESEASESEERPSVGDKVKLTDDYAKYGDASDGPLKPGADLLHTS